MRLGAGEGEEQVGVLVLKLLQHRQHPSHRRRAHIAEQQEHLVLQHQLQGVLDRRVRLVAVVIDGQGDAAPADAAFVVDLGEVGPGAAVELYAQPPRRAGKGRGDAQPKFGVGDAGLKAAALALRQGAGCVQPWRGQPAGQAVADQVPPADSPMLLRHNGLVAESCRFGEGFLGATPLQAFIAFWKAGRAAMRSMYPLR